MDQITIGLPPALLAALKRDAFRASTPDDRITYADVIRSRLLATTVVDPQPLQSEQGSDDGE